MPVQKCWIFGKCLVVWWHQNEIFEYKCLVLIWQKRQGIESKEYRPIIQAQWLEHHRIGLFLCQWNWCTRENERYRAERIVGEHQEWKRQVVCRKKLFYWRVVLPVRQWYKTCSLHFDEIFSRQEYQCFAISISELGLNRMKKINGKCRKLKWRQENLLA